jgi:hypothetical protein
MTRAELVDRDARLLEETRLLALSDPGSVPRSSRWGPDYDPLTILTNVRSHPEHTEIALVNIRIAMHPGEHWAKCADCGRVYLAGDFGDTTCSQECFTSYCAYLNEPGLVHAPLFPSSSSYEYDDEDEMTGLFGQAGRPPLLGRTYRSRP